MKQAQELLNAARKKLAPFVGVVFVPEGDHALVVAAASPEVTGRVGANDLVATAAGVMGGGGGGRPEMAQGKGKDATKIAAARQAVVARLQEAGIASP